jgi:hypothetical protein
MMWGKRRGLWHLRRRSSATDGALPCRNLLMRAGPHRPRAAVSRRLRPKLNCGFNGLDLRQRRAFAGRVISRPNKGGIFLITNCKLTSCALLSVFDAAPSQTLE